MRSRRLPRYLWLSLLAPAAAGVWVYSAPVDANDLSSMDAWGPTPSQIAAAVGTGPADAPSEARRLKFAHLFQQRFRSHQLAIGVRLRADHRATLMCAAYVPRWYMARAAIALDRETRVALRTAYDVDIYETYIGVQRRKIGELRRDATTGLVRVAFNPPYPVDPSDMPPPQRDRMAGQQSPTAGMLAPAGSHPEPFVPLGTLGRHLGFARTGQPQAVPSVAIPHTAPSGR